MAGRPHYVTVRSVDGNHREMVSAARSLGYVVLDVHQIGRGYPDFVVIRPSDQRSWLIEAKVASGTLTEAEKAYALRSRVPVHVVRSVTDLLQLLEVE